MSHPCEAKGGGKGWLPACFEGAATSLYSKLWSFLSAHPQLGGHLKACSKGSEEPPDYKRDAAATQELAVHSQTSRKGKKKGREVMESVHWIMSLAHLKPCSGFHCLWSKSSIACTQVQSPARSGPFISIQPCLPSPSQPHSLCSSPTRLPAGCQTLCPIFVPTVPSAWDALLPTLCSYIFLSFWSQLKCHLFYRTFLDHLSVSFYLPTHICIPFPPFLVFSMSPSGYFSMLALITIDKCLYL